jgi:hypothetical protein
MGDVQRIQRLNDKIGLLNLCLTQTQNERNALNIQMQQSFGDVFLDLFQEVAELDQLIYYIKKEKVRIQNLI